MGFVSQRTQAGPQPAADRNAGPKKGKRKEEAMTCLYCGQSLVFGAHGYVHKEGGGTYMQFCGRCGHQAALRLAPINCPQCGSSNWRDDHCAAPKRS